MQLNSILKIAIIFLVIISGILAIVYLKMSMDEKNGKNKKEEKKPSEDSKEKVAKGYTKESIFNFMEFDKVEDNMIIQKGGKKFLMVIECQGINYDLMSEMEKTAVESGFIQYLNTLRNPIQIYIQTRTVNLEDSLKRYKEKLKKIESDLTAKEAKYKAMMENGNYSEQQLNYQLLEIKRQRNLYDYGRDIIFNTERMSMNRNVLRKKYYLILSYYYSDVDNENLAETEILETAFSNLYTQAQSTIRTLSITGVEGRVLDSYGLIDLLYNAYNRDEAENYGIDRALEAGFDSLYVTAPDILQRKMNAINKTIEEDALKLAEESIKYAQQDLQKEIEKKEKNMDELVAALASQLIDENEMYLDEDVAETAKKIAKKTAKKEGKVNGQKSKNTKKSIGA